MGSFRKALAGRTRWVVVFGLLLLISSAAPVFANSPSEKESEAGPPLPTSQEIGEAIETEASESIVPGLTDPQAAETLPHRDLERSEALELLQAVFEAQLESPAGPFDELHIEKFLSDHAAVIPAGQQPDGSYEESGDGAYEGPTLIESTVPLRTEAPSGKEEAVDLSLEHAEGQLHASNPLVEVNVPQALGEGIELPESGVRIELAGAPAERSPSTDDSVAFYPNVANDTDLAVALAPTAVETLTQLRSIDAPRSQTFNLTLPQGAELRATENGGAKVSSGEETLIGIAPPLALDATGAKVPVSMEVAGSSLTLEVTPDESTKFPVLLDPLYQSYEWNAKNNHSGIAFGTNREQWFNEETGGNFYLSYSVPWTYWPLTSGMQGLYAASTGSATAGNQAGWNYTVPRYFTDYNAYGSRPTSFISHMTLSNLAWQALGAYPSPYLWAGIWDPNNGFVSFLSHEGNEGHSINDMSYQYQFENKTGNVNAKVAFVGLHATETRPSGGQRVYVGTATMQLGEAAGGVPGFGSISGSSQWVDQAAAPINFTVSDAGLGVYAVTVSDEPPAHSWKTQHGCVGVGGNPCPRTWQSTDTGPPALNYEPSVLPQGINYLKVTAEDPLGNVSQPAYAQVKVDHTAPGVGLSGTLTEQSTLGTKWPSYKLKVDATDGTTESPRSGVAKTVIEVDGEVVDETTPGCSTRNCAISREWTLDASQYAAGQHTVKVTATDAVGLAASKTLTIELNQVPPPSVGLSGTMTEQAALGTSRPRYILKVDALSDPEATTPQPATQPTFVSAFGSYGAGNGQFNHPAGIAVDAKGNLWVIDENNRRVEKFNEAGEFQSAFGSYGTANGQFARPTDVATDAKGNLWVTDAGNSRIQQFNEKGEFVKAVGSYGTGNAQFNGPESIAIDAKGNIWVGDTYNARLQEFNEAGEFIRAVGSRGSGPGQMIEPTGIDIGPGGNVWIADWGNNRVSVFSETGAFVRQFGSSGTGNGQFARPDVIDVDTQGNVWVGDQNNGRVQRFDQNGEYVAQFGAKGTGQGQFSFGWPMGIATDAKGNIWVADTGNHRVQRWQIPNYAPTYSSSFGTEGAGNGQFKRPAGIAIDASRNIYVADRENHRIEKFDAAGQFLKAFGAYGSGDGQFNQPTAVAIDPEGDVWVLDKNNSRVQQFTPNGEFISKFGSLGGENGQLAWPEGLAIDAKGDIYVADSAFTNRVQKFNASGEFLKLLGATGTGPGQFKGPSGLAIDSEGNLWVADRNNNRVQMFNVAGEFVRQWQGSGAAAFKPSAIDVDANGTVWVGDVERHRILSFNAYGDLLAQFGSEGSGEGQFKLSTPMGIALDNKRGIWVTDVNNNRVQKWSRPTTSRSELTTEITLDGEQIDSEEASCSTESCSIASEWTLDSSATPVGSHTVQVTATDGLGRTTTTKSLPIDIQRDTTKPDLQAGGELVEAPEGWVEQESYGLSASASDGGYGVTSLVLRVDGEQVASVDKSCVDGGCEASMTKSINMNLYSGGAHSAALIATDGAGNSTTKNWTVNVDPDGHISSVEAIETLEAVDNTSESTVVASTEEVLEPGQIEAGDNPGLQLSGSVIESMGIPDTTTMTTDPEDGFTIQSPDGQTTITPTVSQNSSGVTIAEGVAGVAANTSSEVDSIIRPQYNGAQTFQAIRSVDSPSSYSWTVNVAEGQTLTLVDSQHAAVLYENGWSAFLITAESAHDATGKEVPASLEVSGNVLTLTVDFHSAEFTYPIVAGQGWETSYTSPVIVERPLDEAEEKQREEEERELKEQEELESSPPPAPQPPLTPGQGERMVREAVERSSNVAAPPYPPSGGATASKVRVFTVEEQHVCQIDHCAIWRVYIRNPSYFRGYDWVEWENNTQVHCGWSQHWAYSAVVQVHPEGCDFAGPWKVYKGQGKHLTIWSRFKIVAPVATEWIEFDEVNRLSLKVLIWPNGFQEKVVGHYAP